MKKIVDRLASHANGNRLTRTVNSVTEDYVYDDADKLLEVKIGQQTVKEFTYDPAGRTTAVETSAGTTSLTYDYESRVAGITYPNQSTNSFTYNGLDTRVGMSDSGGSKTFLRDGVSVTSPVLSDGSATYTPAISERRSGATTFYHSGIKNGDSQSSTGQSVTASVQYDAFGNVTSSSGTWKGPFAYGGPYGYQSDPDSGLKLLGHRYYDSSTGRFLTRDPIKDGRNWYSYCESNPLRCVDPSGLWALNRWLVTGDGNADDLMYEGGLLGLNDAFGRWIGHFREEQKWALPVATLGAVPFGGPQKDPPDRHSGARQYTSYLRMLAIRFHGTTMGTVFSRAAVLLKLAIVKPITPGGGRAIGTCPAVVAWFLWVEAVAAIRAGTATYYEPNEAPIQELVNASYE